MRNLLIYFYEYIKFIESRKITINKILSIFDFLLQIYEKKIIFHQSKSFMIIFINSNYKKWKNIEI